MLDLLAHFTALDVLRSRLGTEVNSGAITDAGVISAYHAVHAQYPYAILGSAIDHLLAHDGPSDAEVALLEEATATWIKIRAFQLEYRATRNKIEQVALNPNAPTALADYNVVRQTMADLIERHDEIIATLQAFRGKLLPLAHLTRHPREDDQQVKSWPWRDVVLSRRTGAFAAEIMKLARGVGSQPALAFGVGVVASYVANAIGSPYLVHGVGGPRRSHPYRDRLASYAVGAWLRHVPLPVRLDIERTLSIPIFGSPQFPALPPWLRNMILQALESTYAKHGPPALPRLDAAYSQLIQHWRLLQAFSPLPQAAPIDRNLSRAINALLVPADWDRPDNPQPGGNVNVGPPRPGSAGDVFDPGPGRPPWFEPIHDNVADWIAEICEDILLLPLFLVRVGFWLGHKMGDRKPTNTISSRAALRTPLTAAEFATTTSGKEILIAVNLLFYLDTAIQQLSVDCIRFLKYLGLIYPEPKDLHNPEFLEFLVLPPANLGFEWPARPLNNPNLFLDLPATPLERPAEQPSHFAPGEKPIAFIFKTSGGGETIFNAGFELLTQELSNLPTSGIRENNMDLDADRGVGKLCWNVKKGTSINDDPVQPVDLNYNAV